MLGNCPGPSSNNWQGGRIKCLGYIRILQPGHHRANAQGYVLEHILSWEAENHMPLPDGLDVHHLNGIKDDNRPENLVALKHRDHVRLHNAEKKRIRELETLLKNKT